MSLCTHCQRRVVRNRFALLCMDCMADVADDFERRRGRECSDFEGAAAPMLGTLEERGLATFSGLTVTIPRVESAHGGNHGTR